MKEDYNKYASDIVDDINDLQHHSNPRLLFKSINKLNMVVMFMEVDMKDVVTAVMVEMVLRRLRGAYGDCHRDGHCFGAAYGGGHGYGGGHVYEGIYGDNDGYGDGHGYRGGYEDGGVFFKGGYGAGYCYGGDCGDEFFKGGYRDATEVVMKEMDMVEVVMEETDMVETMPVEVVMKTVMEVWNWLRRIIG